ncbi:MAG: glycosyl hydrolase family protein [Bacteroidetes bacterium]|nr:glycosyl hydrolase family protein [Bacteroidota bacterium]
MLKYFKNIFAACSLLLLASCHKGDITLLTRQVSTNTTDELNSIAFVNDSVGYICGGTRYFIGILLRTTDGGHTWSAPDSVIPKALYSMTFFSAQEGLTAGFDGYVAYTNDSAKTFSSGQYTNLPIQHMSFINRQKGVAACGLGYRYGSVYNTSDGGHTWSQVYSDAMHAYNGAAYIDDSTALVCGYGTILRSHDGGATFTVVKENGEIYQEMKYINGICYAVGYQGEVIRSDDRGSTWRIVRAGNGLFSSADHLFGVDFTDENNGYAVGESGLMVHTSNGGQDWQTVRAFTSERLRSVHMFSATSGIVAGADGKVYLFQQ